MILLPLLGLLISTVTGWATQAWLWPRRGWRADELLWRGCMAVGIGLGLSSCATFLWLSVAPTRVVALYLIDGALMAGAVVLAWCAKRAGNEMQEGTSPIGDQALTGPASLGFRALSAVLIVCAGVAAIFCAVRLLDMQSRQPQGTWDSWMIWNFRARFFYRGGAAWAMALVDGWSWSEPDYPLLVPLSITRLWHYLGAEATIVPELVSVLYPMMTLALLFAALSRLRGAIRGALASLFLAATPLFIKWGGSQCADVPLGFYILASCCALVLASRATVGRGKLFALTGLLISSAAWTKNEGILYATVFMGSLIFLALLRRWRRKAWLDRDRADVGMAIAGALPITAYLIAMKLMLTAENGLFKHHTIRSLLHEAMDPARHRLILAYALGLLRVLPDRSMGLSLILYVLAMIVAAFWSLGRSRSVPGQSPVNPSASPPAGPSGGCDELLAQ